MYMLRSLPRRPRETTRMQEMVRRYLDLSLTQFNEKRSDFLWYEGRFHKLMQLANSDVLVIDDADIEVWAWTFEKAMFQDLRYYA